MMILEREEKSDLFEGRKVEWWSGIEQHVWQLFNGSDEGSSWLYLVRLRIRTFPLGKDCLKKWPMSVAKMASHCKATCN